MKLPLWVKTRKGKWILFPYELLDTGAYHKPCVSGIKILTDSRWMVIFDETDWTKFFEYVPNLDVYFLKDLS